MGLLLNLGNLSIPLDPVESTSKIIINLEFDADTSALKTVYRTGGKGKVSTHGSYDEATVIGVLLNSVQATEFGNVLVLGELKDSNFTWSAGTPLFSDSTGTITDTVPNENNYDYYVSIGRATAVGTIWVQPDLPWEL